MNFFTLKNLPAPGTEQFETLHKSRAVSIERIASNRLADGEWYDQDHDEWVMLARGSARLEYGGGDIRNLEAGDCLLIEARRRHRVLETSDDALWLAVHMKGEGCFRQS
jgi:cupin 2 domain-containing protein